MCVPICCISTCFTYRTLAFKIGTLLFILGLGHIIILSLLPGQDYSAYDFIHPAFVMIHGVIIIGALLKSLCQKKSYLDYIPVVIFIFLFSVGAIAQIILIVNYATMTRHKFNIVKSQVLIPFQITMSSIDLLAYLLGLGIFVHLYMNRNTLDNEKAIRTKVGDDDSRLQDV